MPEELMSLADMEPSASLEPLKKASEAPESPDILIPIVSGNVFDKSFRRTEAEATMYNKIAWPDLTRMKNLSSENSKYWQYSDEDTGNTFLVEAAAAKRARDAYRSMRSRTSEKVTSLA